jgi:prophage regulatory protein
MTHLNEPFTTAAKSAFQPPAPDSLRLIRWHEVHQITGLCRSHVHAMAARGDFPAPIKLGSRASAWVEAEVLQWLHQRIEASRSTTPTGDYSSPLLRGVKTTPLQLATKEGLK